MAQAGVTLSDVNTFDTFNPDKFTYTVKVCIIVSPGVSFTKETYLIIDGFTPINAQQANVKLDTLVKDFARSVGVADLQSTDILSPKFS